MSTTYFDISVSIDGYVTGPNVGLDHPLGEGGERLHDWAIATRRWRELHGREGGEEGPDSELLGELASRHGAVIMGRGMYSGGSGSWEEDPKADGWWGDEPPFGVPVFVLTHHEREAREMLGGTTFHFVTDGIESALERAQAAAGGRDVQVAGGAQAIQQYLRAGLIDEFQLHVAPVMLGSGTRLLDGLGGVEVEQVDVTASPAVTHLSYRVKR